MWREYLSLPYRQLPLWWCGKGGGILSVQGGYFQLHLFSGIHKSSDVILNCFDCCIPRWVGSSRLRDKRAHDDIIQRKVFKPGQLVFLYQSRFKLSGKLTTKWCRPFAVKAKHPNGAVEVRDLVKGNVFKVNGQRLKIYYGQDGVYKRDLRSLRM